MSRRASGCAGRYSSSVIDVTPAVDPARNVLAGDVRSRSWRMRSALGHGLVANVSTTPPVNPATVLERTKRRLPTCALLAGVRGPARRRVVSPRAMAHASESDEPCRTRPARLSSVQMFRSTASGALWPSTRKTRMR